MLSSHTGTSVPKSFDSPNIVSDLRLFFYVSRSHFQVDESLSHPLYFGFLIRKGDIGKHYKFNESGHVVIKPILGRDVSDLAHGLQPWEEISAQQFDDLLGWVLPPKLDHCPECGDSYICQACVGTGRDQDMGVGKCSVCDGVGHCTYCSSGTREGDDDV